jgi:hypothetical protein
MAFLTECKAMPDIALKQYKSNLSYANISYSCHALFLFYWVAPYVIINVFDLFKSGHHLGLLESNDIYALWSFLAISVLYIAIVCAILSVRLLPILVSIIPVALVPICVLMFPPDKDQKLIGIIVFVVLLLIYFLSIVYSYRAGQKKSRTLL